tara:strand:+ start:4254 stop:4433 length:180 start_codon:yes stop_codon:yes gene_type:complete
LKIFGSVLLLALISCSKSEFECNPEIIEAYAVEKCGSYATNEECKSEVVYLITTSCGIN